MMRKKWCRCGHHASAHRGRETGCIGRYRIGKNALGHAQWRWCQCATFRPTQVGWWTRHWSGTEDAPEDVR